MARYKEKAALGAKQNEENGRKIQKLEAREKKAQDDLCVAAETKKTSETKEASDALFTLRETQLANASGAESLRQEQYKQMQQKCEQMQKHIMEQHKQLHLNIEQQKQQHQQQLEQMQQSQVKQEPAFQMPQIPQMSPFLPQMPQMSQMPQMPQGFPQMPPMFPQVPQMFPPPPVGGPPAGPPVGTTPGGPPPFGASPVRPPPYQSQRGQNQQRRGRTGGQGQRKDHPPNHLWDMALSIEIANPTLGTICRKSYYKSFPDCMTERMQPLKDTHLTTHRHAKHNFAASKCPKALAPGGCLDSWREKGCLFSHNPQLF